MEAGHADGGGLIDPVEPIDLTGVPHERVLLICEALAGCGTVVLHGSNVRPALQLLEPRQANDRAKQSGNLCAVYASLDARVALLHALLDRRYLSARLSSWRIGYRHEAGQLRFCASDNLYRLFCQRDPRLLSDGVIYGLARCHFVRAAESETEFHALSAQRPVHILKVAAALGHMLFCTDGHAGSASVVRYP